MLRAELADSHRAESAAQEANFKAASDLSEVQVGQSYTLQLVTFRRMACCQMLALKIAPPAAADLPHALSS